MIPECRVCNDSWLLSGVPCPRCRKKERRDQAEARKLAEAKRKAAIDPRRWLAQVEERSQAQGGTYLLAIVMATRANRRGFVQLTNERMMELCRCKRTKLFEMLAELVKIGELRLHHKGRGEGNHSVYQMLVTAKVIVRT